MPTKVQVSNKHWKIYEKYFDNAYRYNPQEELISFFKQNGIRYVNLHPEFVGKPGLYFNIDQHWTKEGHKLASLKLYEYLINEGLI